MKGYEKYERSYFLPPECTYDWVKKDYIDKAPLWCSVDLRDGNQALIEPMSLEEKLDFFKMLVDIGFKEIEVGFPAASETEFNFTRALIERDMIPDDVTIHVLTQAREHIIKKTFKALEGAPRAVVHLYNSTSVAQREQVFKKSKEEIKQLAVDGAILLRDLAAETDGNFRFQYSPESFSGTEVDYAVDVCNAVLDVWQPKADNKAIINIPTTVENAMPHVFATQIEYIDKHLKYRDGVVLCLHPHNDRGCGVATSELGVLAVDGAILLRDLAAETDGNFRFQYSPESFSGTEVDYAVDVCNAVLDVWQPKADNKAIINIPTTVENAMPHVFATQIEYIDKHLKYRDGVVLCLHPHNDRGCGVATSELGVLAGAEEIEGTLFGNGERTGNVDIVTLAMNLYSHGVDPQLDFSNLPEIREKYETYTRMKVGERQPYAGDLVFSAFSGSHQDAISKGMAWREEKKLDKWTVPYLPIDPKDVGRTYEADVIRINSQSGKGGVAYILKQSFGINVPQQMREQVGYMVKQVSDEEHKELSPDWVHSIFTDNYVDFHPYFTIPECHFKQVNGIFAEAVILHNDSTRKVDANGNGRLDAVSNIIKQYFDISFELTVYEEHALSHGSSSKAMAYVGITVDGKMFWGAGVDEDIIKASIGALVVAVNHYLATKADSHVKDERYIAMLNFIQANYKTVSLADMAAQFNLTEPYISKYIKEKSGKTFGELVTNAKMKKARTLLRNSITTVENIAIEAGYQNVEHFNRQFKKLYGMTPLEYRNSSTK